MTERSGIPEEQLEQYLRGLLDPEEAAAIERRLVSDPELSQWLYSRQGVDQLATDCARETAHAAHSPTRDTQAVGDSRMAADARTRGRGSPRVWIPAIGLAAVLAVVFLRGNREQEDVTRGDEVRTRPLAPLGAAASYPREYRWTRDPEATLYRFELYTADMSLLYRVATADTVIMLPAIVPAPEKSTSGVWRVVAVAKSGNDLPAAPTARFTIEGGR